MKAFRTIVLAIVIFSVTLSQTGCIGSFTLTRKVYEWNKTDVKGKWGQQLVFLAFIFLPVYEFTLFVDAIVLNTIEFWTGSNPLAMAPGEIETKMVRNGDDVYRFTVEKNRFTIEKFRENQPVQSNCFIYDENLQAWTMTNGHQTYLLKNN